MVVKVSLRNKEYTVYEDLPAVRPCFRNFINKIKEDKQQDVNAKMFDEALREECNARYKFEFYSGVKQEIVFPDEETYNWFLLKWS